jgi:hypothetical protein
VGVASIQLGGATASAGNAPRGVAAEDLNLCAGAGGDVVFPDVDEGLSVEAFEDFDEPGEAFLLLFEPVEVFHRVFSDGDAAAAATTAAARSRAGSDGKHPCVAK